MVSAVNKSQIPGKRGGTDSTWDTIIMVSAAIYHKQVILAPGHRQGTDNISSTGCNDATTDAYLQCTTQMSIIRGNIKLRDVFSFD